MSAMKFVPSTVQTGAPPVDPDAVEAAAVLIGDDDPSGMYAAGKLSIRILKPSKCIKRPEKGDLATISLTGKLPDGTVVETHEKLEVHVGDFEVVQGVDTAIPLMSVDEVAELIVPSALGYGALGLENATEPGKSIPPHTTLIYRLHLIDSKNETADDFRTFEILRKYGLRKKERANFWYKRKEYIMAVHLYTRALEYLDFYDCDLQLSEDEAKALQDEGLVVYNNMAMAQIQIENYDLALMSVDAVLRCQPNNSKALYRKGRILDALNDTKEAISFFQKAATLEPNNKVIQQDLSKLIIKARREEHREKEIYQKMMGQVKKMDHKNKPLPKDENSDNSMFKFLGYLVGSLLVIAAGVAYYRFKN